jgi:hypothetical protein
MARQWWRRPGGSVDGPAAVAEVGLAKAGLAVEMADDGNSSGDWQWIWSVGTSTTCV